MKTKFLPRRCWKKLWKHCLKHSETGTIHVRVLSSNRNGYYLLRTEQRKRIGRAIPTLHIIDHQSFVSWEYVN